MESHRMLQLAKILVEATQDATFRALLLLSEAQAAANLPS
jgi:hypothetical protein